MSPTRLEGGQFVLHTLLRRGEFGCGRLRLQAIGAGAGHGRPCAVLLVPTAQEEPVVVGLRGISAPGAL